MSELQFSAAALSSLLAGNQGEGAVKVAEVSGKKTATGQFSSLLDVVGNIIDVKNPESPALKKDPIKNPAAVEARESLSFRSSTDRATPRDIERADDSRYKQTESSSLSSRKAENDNANADTVKRSDKLDNDKPVTAEKTSPSAKKTGKADAAVDKPVDKSTVVTNADSKLEVDDSNHVVSLNNTFDILSQLLAGADGVISSDVAELQEIVVDEVQAISDPLAVFVDLKSVLSQLQQFLQDANTQNTPFSNEQNTALTAINAALQNDLNALKNLSPQLANGDDLQSVFSGLLQTQKVADNQRATLTQQVAQPQDADRSLIFSSITDINSLLKNNMSLIKDSLQKFSNDNIPASLKLDVTLSQTQVTLSQTQIKIAEVVQGLTSGDVDNNTLNSNLGNAKSESAIFANQAAVPAVENVQSQQIIQSQNNNVGLSPVAAAVQAAIAGGDADANTGGNSGQQGGNSGQQGNSTPQSSAGGLASSSTRPSSVVAGSQFSNLLNKTSQAPVTEQVVFHIKSAIGNGNSKIIIQLHPEDLGKLDITLDVDTKGKTSVTITADNKHAVDLLQRDSQGLQKALSDAGLESDPDKLTFNLRGGDKEGQGQNQNQSQASSQYQKVQPEELPTEELDIASLTSVTRSYTVNLPDGLDIKI